MWAFFVHLIFYLTRSLPKGLCEKVKNMCSLYKHFKIFFYDSQASRLSVVSFFPFKYPESLIAYTLWFSYLLDTS